MKKMFFIIYNNNANQLSHKIIFRESKKQIVDEMLEDEFSPVAIFSQGEVTAINNNEFSNEFIDTQYISYLIDHIADWDMAF